MNEPQRVAEGRVKRSTKRIAITDRDTEILKFIHDFRLLRIEHVEVLTGRTYTRVHRRLKGLVDAGFLKRIQIPQKKDIYYVGRPALALLLSHGLISEDEAMWRSREHELRPATLDHEMMIADIHVTVELAARNGPLKLVKWTEGDAIRDTFEVTEVSPSIKVAIQPDAFFQIKNVCFPEGKNRRTFFLEADRSTMPIQPRMGSQRYRDKIDRYRWFIDHGRPFEKYGVRSIRVVTVTLTPERRDNLCADTDAFLVENNLTGFRKFFMFGCVKDVQLANPSTILEPVFRQPGNSKLYPLFPTLAETAQGA